jgi:hypothetical protein
MQLFLFPYHLGFELFNRQVIDMKLLSSAERKRYREKMRRGRVNTSYEALKMTLAQFDSQRYLNRGSSNEMSQEEIVDSTIVVINQLLEENMNAKKRIEELQESFEYEKKNTSQQKLYPRYQQIIQNQEETAQQPYINLSYVPA